MFRQTMVIRNGKIYDSYDSYDYGQTHFYQGTNFISKFYFY